MRVNFERLQLTFWGRLSDTVLHRLLSGELSMRAMSLAYLTLLAIVPLLAVCFAILKAFGVHDQLQPVLLQVLAPLGEQSQEITSTIVAFVENVRVGVLGFAGITFLFYTIISLVRRIEKSINAIWHIAKNRSLARTFSDYLSVILIGPVLLFSALGLSTTLLNYHSVQAIMAIEPLGTVIVWAGKVLPVVLICATFAFLYGFIPNTRVRPGAAVAGAVFAGLLWSASGWLFAGFVVRSSNYSAVYSGFAGVVLAILWLHLAWLIVLLGAQVAYCWQYPQASFERKKPPARQLPAGDVALNVMALLGHAHRRPDVVFSRERIAIELDLAPRSVMPVINKLIAHGLVVETRETPSMLLPTRDTNLIKLTDVVAAVDAGHVHSPHLPAMHALQTERSAALAQVLAGKTVADIAQ